MRGILLDLDDTLLDDRTATRTGLAAFLTATRHLWPSATEAEELARWRTIAAKHWVRFERAEITFLEQRRERVREFLGLSFSDSDADRAFEPYRAAYESAWRLFPECAEFFRRTASVPKVVVTNGDREQQLHKLRTLGLLEHLAGVVTPTDCGHWKPRREIFLAALAILKLEPAECCMIGDDRVRDIEPAGALGMQVFHVEYGNGSKTLLHAVSDA